MNRHAHSPASQTSGLPSWEPNAKSNRKIGQSLARLSKRTATAPRPQPTTTAGPPLPPFPFSQPQRPANVCTEQTLENFKTLRAYEKVACRPRNLSRTPWLFLGYPSAGVSCTQLPTGQLLSARHSTSLASSCLQIRLIKHPHHVYASTGTDCESSDTLVIPCPAPTAPGFAVDLACPASLPTASRQR